jgi:hypothetical protein
MSLSSRSCSVVHSRLDYYNSLIFGVSKTNIDKLQLVQNRAARIVCCVNRRQFPASDLVYSLHWLPVHNRIAFKIAALCFKAHKRNQPCYLSAALEPYNPTVFYVRRQEDCLSNRLREPN